MSRVVWSALAVLALTTACATKNQPTLEAAPPTEPSTTSTSVVTTTPEQRLKTPAAAAGFVFEAWRSSNRATALLGASQAAVDMLFGRPFSPGQLRGCDAPTSLGSDCLYRLSPGALRMHVKGTDATGYRVEAVEFTS